MGVLPPASLGQSSTNRSALAASTAPGNGSSDAFAQLLALQLGQNTGALGALGAGASDASANSANDLYAALLPGGMGQSSGGLSQMEGLLTLRLLEVVERLLSNSTSALAPQAPTGLPATGPISQPYHPGHTGIDVAVPLGTPIHSTMPGKVTYAGWNTEGYGNLVIVENGPYRTYYAHLQSIPVTVGQNVDTGAVVGLSGSTGHSTGPHLHYEVRVNGQPVSPVEPVATAQA